MTAGFCRHAEHPLKFGEQFEAFKCLYQHDPDIFMPATQIIPCSTMVVRAWTPESKVRVPSRSLGLIDSIGWLLSIIVGYISPGQGIDFLFFFSNSLRPDSFALPTLTYFFTVIYFFQKCLKVRNMACNRYCESLRTVWTGIDRLYEYEYES